MPLTEHHLHHAALIDDFVKAIFERGGNEEDVLRNMIGYMPSFKTLLDSTTSTQMDELCQRFDGFYVFASMLEAMATGIAEGEIDVPPAPKDGADNVHTLVPKLTVNETFIQGVFNEPTPCVALGLVEERKRRCGLFALRTEKPIPPEMMEGGFRFGQSLLGNNEFEVLHFSFEFYGFGTYNVLINPNNPVVLAVLDTMLQQDDYFILAFDPNEGVTAFRSETGDDSLAGLKVNYSRIAHSTTTVAQYEKALALFAENPFPEGTLLTWVCQDNPAASCRRCHPGMTPLVRGSARWRDSHCMPG